MHVTRSMSGLGAIDCSLPQWRGFQYCQDQAAQKSLAQGSRNAGRMTATECQGAGGVPVNCAKPSPGQPGFGNTYCDCLIAAPVAAPAPAPQAPANITVSPQIVTQVSPQISPVFQQQFQPTNSPASAGTSMTSAPAQVPAAGVTGGSQLAPAPMPAPAPQYAAPAPQPQYTPPPQYPATVPASVSSPDMAPVTASAPATPQPVAPAFDWKMGAIFGLGLFGLMAMTGNIKRGK